MNIGKSHTDTNDFAAMTEEIVEVRGALADLRADFDALIDRLRPDVQPGSPRSIREQAESAAKMRERIIASKREQEEGARREREEWKHRVLTANALHLGTLAEATRTLAERDHLISAAEPGVSLQDFWTNLSNTAQGNQFDGCCQFCCTNGRHRHPFLIEGRVNFPVG